MPSPIMRKAIVIAVLAAVVAIGVLAVPPIAVTQDTSTGTGTVTLTVNSFVDINVVDGQIQITFTPQTRQATAWFAVNVNDYFNVTEGASNVNVTLGVYDYTANLPSDYPPTLLKPLLLFHIGSSETDYNGIYFNATVKADVDPNGNPDVPDTLTINGVSLQRDTTASPIAYNVPLSSVAVYYDSSTGVGTYSSDDYICLASAQYLDGSGSTYVVVFGKIQSGSCDYNFTATGDYAIAPTNSSNNLQDYVLNVMDVNNYQAYLRVYSITEGSYVVLKPVVPLQYDGQETPTYIFAIVRLPVAAPQGQYQFTVTLQTWSAEG